MKSKKVTQRFEKRVMKVRVTSDIDRRTQKTGDKIIVKGEQIKFGSEFLENIHKQIIINAINKI
jgi:hypothetical protein